MNGEPLSPRRWEVRQADENLACRLARALDVPPLLGRLLTLRGICDPAEARDFLRAPLDAIHDPFLMKGMEEAASHLARQVLLGHPIGIYGDFDVDGISATALLLDFFSAVNAQVAYHIPHRLQEGYGLHLPGLERLREEGCETVVTVDCGISAADVAEEAKRLGICLIVTDHHRPPARLPDALAVLNPRQPGCYYPFKGLTGVGIAFKLATAVRRRLRDKNFEGKLPNLKAHLDLVALGTIADAAPLVGENRILVRTGLEVLSPPQGGEGFSLRDGRKAGVRALQASADLKAEVLTADHVGFILAPRLNAAGRVGDARLGVDLLMAKDGATARAYAERLEEWNRQRQALQQEAIDEAALQLEVDPPSSASEPIVLASARWHPGVLGIVASRLVEEHGRPVVLVHFDGEEGRGSARGVPQFHLYEALDRCSDLLVRFGGHKGAAGLTIRREMFPLFRERFGEVARESLEAEAAGPELSLDAVVDFAELEPRLLERVEEMAPFGVGNPRPLFAAGGVEVVGTPSAVGRDGGHLKLTLSQRGEAIQAIGFGMGDLLKESGFFQRKLDVAFFAGMNRWRGRAKVQLELRALRPAGG